MQGTWVQSWPWMIPHALGSEALHSELLSCALAPSAAVAATSPSTHYPQQEEPLRWESITPPREWPRLPPTTRESLHTAVRAKYSQKEINNFLKPHYKIEKKKKNTLLRNCNGKNRIQDTGCLGLPEAGRGKKFFPIAFAKQMVLSTTWTSNPWTCETMNFCGSEPPGLYYIVSSSRN